MSETLTYNWQYGQEELILTVNTYTNNNSLYVGLLSQTEYGLEPFDDLTVNLPDQGTPLKINEAYISNLASADKLAFIRQHHLGTVLPERGFSGFCSYAKVSFDLDRLKELDPAGVKQHLQLNQERDRRKRKADMER